LRYEADKGSSSSSFHKKNAKNADGRDSKGLTAESTSSGIAISYLKNEI